MNKMQSAALIALTALSLGSGVAQAAPELVTNGGFEANAGSWGALTNWTTGTFEFASKVSDNVVSSTHSGTYVAGFSANSTLDYLTQTALPTTAGQNYTFSFWLLNTAFFLNSNGTGNVNQFTASFNGTTVFNQTDIAANGWQQYSFNVLATSAATTISFGGRNAPGYFGLDDVSVQAITAVPEPGMASMLLAGLAGIGFIARRRVSRQA